jgi:hypothetical protein
MNTLLMVLLVVFIVVAIGGVGGYLIWRLTRPTKETWNARIYQLAEGVREPLIVDGKVVSSVKLQDLKPYALDVLERLEKAPGITIYRLQRLDKIVPPVEGDVVDYWNKDNKEVSILLFKGSCTILRKGYNKVAGEIIFDPLPYSRINTIKSEMAMRKDRLKDTKSILEAISPWIVTGMLLIGLVAMTYILGTSFVKISDNYADASQKMGDSIDKLNNNSVMLAYLVSTMPGRPVNVSLGSPGNPIVVRDR